MSRRLLLAACFLLTLTLAPLGGAPASAATLDAAEADLVAQVNSFRASRGLPTLALSDTITAAAKWMATDMATNNYFSHTSLDGRSPTQRMADAGYPAFTTYTGENIAAGYTSAGQVLAGWIASPGHYAVLTNPNYHAIGVGRAYSAGATYGTYWDMDVGGVVDSAAAAPAPVVDSGYHAAWAAQSPYVTLAPGQTTDLVLGLLNTGSRGWIAGSPGQQANLGTSQPLDVPRTDLAYGWPSANRPATQTTSWVGPGQVGWFKFTVRAPATAGPYVLNVRGVIDGTTWLEDQGVFWIIQVQ